MKLEKVYIALVHYFRPAQGEMTQKKEWGKEGKWQADEKIVFTRNLKDKILDSATVILEYTNKEIIKDRVKKGDFNSYIKHISENHKEEFQAFKKNYDTYIWAMNFREESMKKMEKEQNTKQVENFIKQRINTGEIPESFTVSDVEEFMKTAPPEVQTAANEKEESVSFEEMVNRARGISSSDVVDVAEEQKE